MNKLKQHFKDNTISYLSILLIMLGISTFVYLRIRYLIDDDVSSEMVLGHLMYTQGNHFLCPKWIYSTEIRLFNMQAIYAFLFKFISSWFQIRVITTITIAFLFALSLFKMCKSSELSKLFPLILFCFFMPLSYDVLYGTTVVLSYWVYVIYSFLILIEYFNYYKTKNNIHLVLSVFLSIAICTAGPRFILQIYLPLLATSLAIYIFKRNEKRILIFSSISFIGAIIGFIIYKIFIEGNFFIPGLAVLVIKPDITRINLYLKCFIENFGYGQSVLFNLISIFIFLLSIVSASMVILNHKTYSFYSLSYALFYLFGTIGMGFCIVLSTIQCENRYLYVTTIFAIPIIFSFINEIKNIKKALIILVLISFAYGGFNTYIRCFKIDKTSELDYIQSELITKGYENGYAFFWSNNVITELSNGVIDMYCLGFTSTTDSNYKNIETKLTWLQNIDHMTQIPDGKVFILLTNEEKEKFLDLIYYFTEKDIVIVTENYTAYGFNSYSELKEVIRF